MNKEIIKTISLQNIRCFYNFVRKEYLENSILKKRNIIYGDNGNGKSTITKIFKYLNGDLEKLGKHRIDNLNLDQEIVINNDSNNSEKRKGRFLIFDKEFIRKNVSDFYGDESDDVRRENEKTRGEKYFYLGGFHEKEKEYDEIKNNRDIAEKDKSKIQYEIEHTKSLFSNFDKKYKSYVETYKNLGEDKILLQISETNNIIDSLVEEKARLKKQINNKNNILYQEELEKIIIEFDEEKVISIFSSSFTIQNNLFEYGLKHEIQKIAQLIINNNLDTCPVCKSTTKDSTGDILQTIKEVIEFQINNELIEQEEVIQQGINELKYIYKNIESVQDLIDKVHGNNASKLSKEIGISQKPVKVIISFNEDWNNVLNRFNESIEKKSNLKSKALTLEELDRKQPLKEILNELNSQLKDYNDKIDIINKEIRTLKSKSNEDFDLEERSIKNNIEIHEENLEILKNLQRFEKYDLAQEEYNKKEEEYRNLENQRKKARNLIDFEFKGFVQKYGEKIKHNIKELNSSIHVDFEIESRPAYSNGSARSTFKIIIPGDQIDIGNSFSEGEKRCIGLAYFFTQIDIQLENLEIIEKKINNAQKTGEKRNISQLLTERDKINRTGDIVIFDDPSVDFDSGHKQQIASHIHKNTINASQVIILSHDLLFTEYLKPYHFEGKFRINKTNSYSSIMGRNNEQIKYYESKLKHIQEGGKFDFCELNTYIHILRYCVERKVKSFQGFYGTKFIDIINGFREENLEIYKLLCSEKSSIESLYEYCNKNGSHSSINEPEGFNSLKKKIDLYFKLLGVIDSSK